MKKFFVCSFMLVSISVFFCGCTISTSSQPEIKTSQELGDTMMNYFLKKNTAELFVILNYISKSDYLNSNKSSTAPIIGFYAGIQHENPKIFKKLQQNQNNRSTTKMLKSSKEFENIMEDMLKREDYYIERPALLDAFWGYFYATGDDRVIKKLCETSLNSTDILVKEAAKWSLASNKQQYPAKIKECSLYK